MGTYLNPGKRCFEERLNAGIYMDKTEMIGYLNSLVRTGLADMPSAGSSLLNTAGNTVRESTRATGCLFLIRGLLYRP